MPIPKDKSFPWWFTPMIIFVNKWSVTQGGKFSHLTIVIKKLKLTKQRLHKIQCFLLRMCASAHKVQLAFTVLGSKWIPYLGWGTPTLYPSKNSESMDCSTHEMPAIFTLAPNFRHFAIKEEQGKQNYGFTAFNQTEMVTTFFTFNTSATKPAKTCTANDWTYNFNAEINLLNDSTISDKHSCQKICRAAQ